MVNRQDQLDIHCNLFDSSFVEYFLDDPTGQFDILFDQKLYEPAKTIVDFEKKMQETQEGAQAQKGKNGRWKTAFLCLTEDKVKIYLSLKQKLNLLNNIL